MWVCSSALWLPVACSTKSVGNHATRGKVGHNFGSPKSQLRSGGFQSITDVSAVFFSHWNGYHGCEHTPAARHSLRVSAVPPRLPGSACASRTWGLAQSCGTATIHGALWVNSFLLSVIHRFKCSSGLSAAQSVAGVNVKADSPEGFITISNSQH